MVVDFFEYIGDKTIRAISSFFNEFYFSLKCLIHIFLPKSYDEKMRTVLIQQIYFTAIEILPLFIFTGLLFGSVGIGFMISQAVSFSLQEEIGKILIGFIMNEFAPFFTVLIISIRSGSVINTEIALLKANSSLKVLDRDIIDDLFLPRILAGIVAMIILSTIFTIIMLSSGYLFSSFFLHMNIDLYLETLINALSVEDLPFLLFKTIIFGFLAMFIPIYSGYKTTKQSNISRVVLDGKVKLFVSILSIEAILFLLH